MNKNGLSDERKVFLKRLKIKKIEILVTQILIIVIFILLWEFLASIGKIDSFITSQPSRILKTFLNLSSNDLLKHLNILFIAKNITYKIGILYSF